MQLLVMNLTDYQRAQNDMLVLNEKSCIMMDIFVDTIEIYQI